MFWKSSVPNFYHSFFTKDHLEWEVDKLQDTIVSNILAHFKVEVAAVVILKS